MADGTQVTTAKLRSTSMKILKPIYSNDTLATQLLTQLNIAYVKPSSQTKAKIVAASFLYTAKEISESDTPLQLGWPHTNNHWTDFPAVGKKIIKEVREALIAANLIELLPATGKTIFDDYGKIEEKITTLYSIAPCVNTDFKLATAKFADSYRIPVRVTKEETYPERCSRKAEGRSSPKLSGKDSVDLFRGEWGKATIRMKTVNAFYTKHPLVLPDGFKCSSVTRIFGKGKLSVGGRLYGAYSNHEQSDRVKSTIDGQPVCEVDIRASQISLLTFLLGYNLGKSWSDIYATLPMVKDESDPVEKAEARGKVKSVVTEILGSGNPNKSGPSPELEAKGVNQFLFLSIREEIEEAIPALAKLKTLENMTKGDLSFHESEIILGTIEHLITKGIPAYSVHDSIIVKRVNQDAAIATLRDTWSAYCIKVGKQNGQKKIFPAVSITQADMSEANTDGRYA